MDIPGPGLDSAPLIADPFTQPAPHLPGLDRPDSTFTYEPGTSTQLLGQNAWRMAVRPTLVALCWWLPLAVIGLLLAGATPAIWLAAFVLIPVLLAGEFWWRLRRGLASVFTDRVPAPSWSVRCGADGLDIVEDDSHTRITHDRLTAITVSGPVAVLRYDGRLLAVPAPLFPAPMVDRLQQIIAGRHTPSAADPPPLPPLPALPDPHVVMTAGPDTARILALAGQRLPWRGPMAKAAVVFLVLLPVEFAVIGGLRLGALGVAVPLLVGGLVALAAWFHTHHPQPGRMCQLEPFAHSGARLSAQFGADAVLIATPTFVLRVRYADITRVEVRQAAVLHLGRLPLVLPGELFPPQVTDRWPALGVEISG